jgi:hypothetical protein
MAPDAPSAPCRWPIVHDNNSAYLAIEDRAMKHRGRLLYDGHVVLDDIRVALEYPSRSRGASWSGRFALPPGASVQAGGPYDLELFDGRAARVLMPRSVVNFGTSDGVAEFLGSGPLEHAASN